MKNSKKEFNPKDWLNNEMPTEEKKISTNKPAYVPPKRDNREHESHSIEDIVSKIETQALDITDTYENWLNLGFALSDELGESGREYFHRISKFHPEYSYDACDKQYDKCLNSNKYGITIKTFFFHAKNHGINASSSHTSNHQHYDGGEALYASNAAIPSEVYNNLPEILKDSTDLFEDAIEKDVVLIGALAVISATLPNIYGKYFNENLSPHLYAFITAPAASGKGKMKWAKYLGSIIHKSMIEDSNQAKVQYEVELENYNNAPKAEKEDLHKPAEPKTKMFYIPANSSSSAFLQVIADNDFNGVIFETEADTLAQTLKQDWGNFSDVLRKAFHHEESTMRRRKDDEYLMIENPHLAIALSGTPKQVHHMMPDVENGLFSRFLFYAFHDEGEFKNPFVSYAKVDYVDFFKSKGQTVFEIYQYLKSLDEPILFQFTKNQGELFTSRFKNLLNKNKLLLGADFDANIKRLGIITFRIAMILSSLRIAETGEYNQTIICSDQDFETAFNITRTLEKHAVAVYKNLPTVNLKASVSDFFDKLPYEFNREKYLIVANKLNIHKKTAEKYLKKMIEQNLLHHVHNYYRKN